MKLLIALISLIILFPILMVIKLSMTIIGFLTVAIAIPFSKEIVPAPEWPRAAKRVVYDDWTFVALPKWADWCWGSLKYGARGNWFWPEHYEDTRSFKAMYMWLAVRNACSNLNNMSIYTYEYMHEDIDYIGTKHIDDNNGIEGIRFAWNKNSPWRSNFTILKKIPSTDFYLWWRIGYKHTPGEGPATAVFATPPIPNPFKKL